MCSLTIIYEMNIRSLYYHMNNSHSPQRQGSRRAYRKRRIASPPRYKNYKPSGIPRTELQQTSITLDEYEAFRLADYEGHDHLNASIQMKISRPTFSRLIEKARGKIAHAIIDGHELTIEGGNIDFSQALHRCRDCGEEHNHPINARIDDCPECGSEDVENITDKYLETNAKDQGPIT